VRHTHAAHWGYFVRFVVGQPGDQSDKRRAYELPNKHDAVADLIADATVDIESQIDFVEVPVKRNGEPAQTRVEELKPDRTDQGSVPPEIEFGAGWNA
jgi:hypothetical protein